MSTKWDFPLANEAFDTSIQEAPSDYVFVSCENERIGSRQETLQYDNTL